MYQHVSYLDDVVGEASSKPSNINIHCRILISFLDNSGKAQCWLSKYRNVSDSTMEPESFDLIAQAPA